MYKIEIETKIVLLLDKIGQISVGTIDGTKSGEERHHRDTNHAHTTHALLDRENTVLGTENWKRIADFPK